LLQVAHMTRTPMPLYDTSLLGPLLLWMNNHFGKMINEQVMIVVVLVSSFLTLRRMHAAGLR